MATISVFVACCLLNVFRLVEQTVIPLTTVDFEQRIVDNPSFVMFYGPWCEHCKSLLPTWEDLSSEYQKKNKQINIAKVDCIAETPLCAKHNIKAYPSLRLYHEGGVRRYYGKRNTADFTKFVNEIVFKESSESESSEAASVNDVRILTANNFDQETATGLHFVKFYAPWCIHCIRLAPIWEKLATKYKGSAHVSISKIDCTVNKAKCNEFNVNAFPTLKLYQDGKEIDQYTGNRALHDLDSYVAIKISEYSPPTPTTPPTTAPVEDTSNDDGDDLIKPYQLNQNNFEATVSFGTTFVKFYAPWQSHNGFSRQTLLKPLYDGLHEVLTPVAPKRCVHCKNLAPIWDKLAKKCAETAGGPKIAKIDCTAEEQLCQNFGVNGYPTLTLFKDGHPKQEYTGGRDLESLYKFVMANHDKDEL